MTPTPTGTITTTRRQESGSGSNGAKVTTRLTFLELTGLRRVNKAGGKTMMEIELWMGMIRSGKMMTMMATRKTRIESLAAAPHLTATPTLRLCGQR
jgi:hypothetical protein